MDFSKLIPIKVGFARVATQTLDGLKKEPYLVPMWVIEDGKGPFGFYALGLETRYWMGLN